MSRAPHPPGCRCSNCHLSSKLFPRTQNDRIILPAIPGGHADPASPKSPHHMGTDRTHFAPPPRPKSTAPHEYRPRANHPPPPMPPMPTSRGYGGGDSSSSSRRSMDMPAPMPTPMHRPIPQHAQAPPMPGYGPERGHRFAPPDRPSSAMAAPRRDARQQEFAPPPQQQQQPQQQGEGNLEWTPPRLKWVKKKERVSHFTPPSQYQGTSFRQYVHDGVSSRH
ncbi:hypothetical protein B0H11DRAFT_1976280 [Mycena galericulata]|nr:hypothetical protein B0H11DRAFT_1976280 [Mycena galericulata]